MHRSVDSYRSFYVDASLDALNCLLRMLILDIIESKPFLIVYARVLAEDIQH